MINNLIKKRINMLRSTGTCDNDYFGGIAKIAYYYGLGDLDKAKQSSNFLLNIERCEYGNHWLMKVNENSNIDYSKEKSLFDFDKIRLNFNDSLSVNRFISYKEDLFIDNSNAHPGKRVAVCISGQIRGLDKTVDSINSKIIKALNADVFVTVWDTIGGNPQRYLEKFYKMFPRLNKNDFSDFFELHDLIKLKLGVNKDYIDSVLTKIESKVSAQVLDEIAFDREQDSNLSIQQLNQRKLYYTMNKCLDNVIEHEKSSGINYDYIIKLRPDKSIVDEVDLVSIKKNELQFNNNEFFGPGDQTIIGLRDDMVAALSFYNYFKYNKSDYKKIFNLKGEIDEHKNFGEYLWALGFSFKRYSLNCNGGLHNFNLKKEDFFSLPFLKFIEPILNLEEKENLMRMMGKENIRNDVDIIRDAAITLEKYDVKLSYEMMKLASTLRPEGQFIKNKLTFYGNELFKRELTEARHFMRDGMWEKASIAFENIRKEFPQRSEGFIEGGIALRNFQKIDDAAKVWMLSNTRRARSLTMDVLEKIESKELYNTILDDVLKEKFDLKMPTILSEFLHKQWIHGDRSIANKYLSIIRNNESVDYYTKLAMGLVKEPDVQYLKDIFMTKSLYVLPRIASTAPFHRFNMKVIKENNIHLYLENSILEKLYSNIFMEDDTYNIELPNKKLKIAVCISGQLRGYEKAFKTWDILKFSDHDVDLFCSVWDNVGRKKINRMHIDRLFSKNFSKLFVQVLDDKGEAATRETFTNLFSFFDRNVYIKEEEVKRFYSAKKVSLVKELDFSDKSNAYKMYYMIQRCYDLIDDPEKYDLIVRIRPDKTINNFDVSWENILGSLNNKRLYADLVAEIRPGGVFVGDQFSVSTPEVMKVYAQTFNKVLKATGVFSEKDYSGFTPHKSLCLSLMEEGIYTPPLLDGIKLGALVDADRLSSDSLLEIIKKDLENHPDLLIKFVKAIENDKKESII